MVLLSNTNRKSKSNMASTKAMQELARQRRRVEQGKPATKPQVIKEQREDKRELRAKGYPKSFIQYSKQYGGDLK